MAGALRQIGTLAAADVAALGPVARLQSLAELLHAGLDVVEIVVQDEYTHDVVARGRGPAYLCFDTT
jgi:hypothetical protein